MSSPSTYFEWSRFLERFAGGDDAVLPDLEQGTFVVDAGTVYRFYNKVREAYVERKKQWGEKFNRSFQVQSIRTESDIEIVLRNAKTNLQPIARLIKLPALPRDLHETLRKDFEGFVADVRNNMKESIKKNQPHNEKVLFVINTFSFFEMSSPGATKGDTTAEPESGSSPKNRRIIF